ncbi:MAG: RHS repeat-associated core domain-containing protein, partial [Chloroflexota bacterium]
GDALGSVRQMTDVNGAVTYTAAYSPYGETLGSQGAAATPYGFTGEWSDPSGLVYLRARYFSPAQGRFTTRDTWEGNPSQPLTYNLWGYANNNPVMNTDPSGFSAGQPPTGGFPPATENYDQTVPPRNITWITNGIASSISRHLAPIYDSSGDLVTRTNAAQFMIAGHEKYIYCASYLVINGQPVLDENNRQICAKYRSGNTNFCGQVVLAVILFHFNPYITATTIVDALNRQDGTTALQLANYLNNNYPYYLRAEDQYLDNIARALEPGLFFTFMTSMFNANKLVVPLVNIAQGFSGEDLTGINGMLSGVAGDVKHWILITGVSAQWETSSNSPYNWIRIFNPFDNQTEYYWWPDFIGAWERASNTNDALVVTLNRINTRARQIWR